MIQMKHLLLVPLLLTLLVGCGNSDKTFIERRDDCADALGGVISYEEFDKKYNLDKEDKWGTGSALLSFCSFYQIGGRY